MKNYKQILIVAVLVIIAIAGGFFAGSKYQQSKNPRGGNQQGARGASFAQRGQNFRPVSGEILSQNDNNITVKLTDGSSKIVIIGDKTTINKSAEGSKADLTSGEKVAVFGTENSDGSITAQNVQLNPQMRRPQESPM